MLAMLSKYNPLPARADDYFHGNSPVVLGAANWGSPPARAPGTATPPGSTQPCGVKKEVFEFWLNRPGLA